MSLITIFELDTPVLDEALSAAPGVEVHTEERFMGLEGATKMVSWVIGESFQTFERGLGADPTIREYKRITDIDDRRLYRLTLSEEGEGLFTYEPIVEQDIVILKAVATHETVRIRARIPSRDALYAYRDYCRDRDIPFRLVRLYHEEQTASDGGSYDPYGVTAAQREALMQALNMGYFAIPRQTTMSEIATELGISEQAVSARLRRGQVNLLENTLA